MNARFTFYCHTNRVNGKRYVGQTVDTMEGRWKEHVSAARQNRGARIFGAAIHAARQPSMRFNLLAPRAA
jgi:hypothetical protein